MGLGVDAASLEPGRGVFDLGFGLDQDGLLGQLGLLYRFDPRVYAGLEGRLSYGLAGPRRHRWGGSILGVIGGRF